eukprot:6179115-Pleurochrysis_carterae.AAC.2
MHVRVSASACECAQLRAARAWCACSEPHLDHAQRAGVVSNQVDTKEVVAVGARKCRAAHVAVLRSCAGNASRQAGIGAASCICAWSLALAHRGCTTRSIKR